MRHMPCVNSELNYIAYRSSDDTLWMIMTIYTPIKFNRFNASMWSLVSD